MIWLFALYVAVGLLVATFAATAYQRKEGLNFFRDWPGRFTYAFMALVWPLVLAIATKAGIDAWRANR